MSPAIRRLVLAAVAVACAEGTLLAARPVQALDFQELYAAGITFVGPSAAAMRKLGGKIEAKQLAVASGVPITPGFFEPGANCAH